MQATFSVADDLLAEAARGRLQTHGPIEIEKSGLIGPLVELISAAAQFPDEYESISLVGEFASQLKSACASGVSFGGAFNEKAGAFPLPLQNPIATGDHLWEQWLLHAENVAKSHGVDAPLISSFIGALIEMQDNIYEHSEAPQTGIVAYAVKDRSFEFVVSDRGIGVLETLRQNPSYSGFLDSGSALEAAIQPGVSRFPTETGRGQGYNQLHRAMVTYGAELRFRSGDHALKLRPTSDSLNAEQILTHTAKLAGLTISAIWRAE
jgi:hypothetical protein